MGRERARAWSRPGSRWTASTGAASSIWRRCASETGISPGAAAGGGSALVHGDLRARQPDHQLPGAAVRARAGGDHAARRWRSSRRGPTTRSATRSRARSCTSSGFGELTAFEERPHSPYYGAADATTLFLILLEEYERWTGDNALVRDLEREARAALTLDRPLRRPRRRRLRRVRAARRQDRASTTSAGRTRGTRSRSPTARSRRLPRATCEIQGYVYDAKRRMARLAREVWGDPALGRQAGARGGGAQASASTRTSGSPTAASSRWRSTVRSARSTR